MIVLTEVKTAERIKTWENYHKPTVESFIKEYLESNPEADLATSSEDEFDEGEVIELDLYSIHEHKPCRVKYTNGELTFKPLN